VEKVLAIPGVKLVVSEHGSPIVWAGAPPVADQEACRASDPGKMAMDRTVKLRSSQAAARNAFIAWDM
jgi:hypothetical protein